MGGGVYRKRVEDDGDKGDVGIAKVKLVVTNPKASETSRCKQ